MIAFIIVHKPTGNWFPQSFAPGQTYIEIRDKPFKEVLPRLWATRGRAEGWLKMYCKGPTLPYKKSDKGFNGDTFYYVSGTTFDTTFVRPISEYEIQPIRLENT